MQNKPNKGVNANLIVRLSVIVQGHDVLQEGTKLWGKVLQHESMIVCLF